MDNKKRNRFRYGHTLTGEDIDMLHEKESDPQASEERGSYRYKDNIDGA